MVDPQGFIGAFLAIVVGVTMAGAVLGIDTSGLVNGLTLLFAALLPGVFIGAIVAAVVARITDSLPAALLFGGTTATVLTIVIRVWIWVEMHAGH